MSNFLTEQIITYIGNKRLLLHEIETLICRVKKEEGKEKLRCADLFAGSGIVARMLKAHSSYLVVNDLEEYSRVINRCYLSNPSDFNEELYEICRKKLEEGEPSPGIISENYAPRDDEDIRQGERVFYTAENALRIDTYRKEIENLPRFMQKFFLGPLLYEASVHVNTGGVFKGFYKDRRTGKGKFGGTGENALCRIKGKITLKKPVLSPVECSVEVFREDAGKLVKSLPSMDLIYLDPPYNQHPYGSNYFMLNIIATNRLDGEISRVSGIPKDWNRSVYNKKRKSKAALEDVIRHIPSRYLILSYNSEGFIERKEMEEMLKKYGRVEVEKVKYNTYRASRNLRNRSVHVDEYLFLVKKDGFLV